MRYLSLAYLMAACAAPALLVSDTQEEGPDLVNLRQKTVQVFVDCPTGSGSGSGVVLGYKEGYTYYATAKHVTESHDCHVVINSEDAKIEALHAEVDVAIISQWGFTPFTTDSADNTYLGIDVWAAGYPSQLATGKTKLSITRGTLATKLSSSSWRVTSPMWFGSSGGPIFDKDGNLVCIAKAVLVDPASYTPLPGEFYCVPASFVYELY